MAARGRKRYKGATRDGSGFVDLPHAVLDSPAYAALSHPAKALLIEVARQFHGDDNGRMVLTRDYLKPRGWKSADVVFRAKHELLNAGFIHETKMGQRPNKASWYACTWRPLDKLDGYDAGRALLFERSAYMKRCERNASAATTSERSANAQRTPATGGASLIPSPGTEKASIAPSPGTENSAPIPPGGPIRADFDPLPVPSPGHPLEMPSPAAPSMCALPGVRPERLPETGNGPRRFSRNFRNGSRAQERGRDTANQ